MAALPANVRASDMEFTRTEDGYHIGYISLNPEGFTGARPCPARPTAGGQAGPRTESQTFDRFEDALAWLHGSPYLPDLDRFSCHHGLYGPVLITLPNIRVIGRVGTATMNPYASFLPLGSGCATADLVLMDPRRRFCGWVRETRGTWEMKTCTAGEGRAPLIRRKRTTGMVQTLLHALVQQHPYITAHERLALTHTARTAAEAALVPFLNDRTALRAQFAAGRGLGPG